MYSVEYNEISVLNQGSYGTVTLVEDRRRRRKFAAKHLKSGKWWCKCQCNNEARHEARVRVLLKNHPNILRLEEVRDDVLFFEYCPRGDLYEAIRRGDLKPQAARTVMIQLCDAVAYCHQRGVCHRDIKPENVLVGADNCFKLADFGFASIGRWCSDFGTGSESYMAPECFAGKDKYDAELADIWSLGICLLNILFSKCPWKQAVVKDRRFGEYMESRESLFDDFAHLSRDVYKALQFALCVDPKKRDLAQFRQALLDVEVWTTKEELARLSLTECVPMPAAPRTTGSRPPLPLPTPRSRLDMSLSDVDEEDTMVYWSRSSSSHHGSTRSTINSLGVFDFEEDLQLEEAPGLDNSPGTTTDTSIEPIQQRSLIASVPPPTTLSCSWADLDEDFYPHSTSKYNSLM